LSRYDGAVKPKNEDLCVKFSYDTAWADGVAMAKSQLSPLLTIAGVFFLVPQFALTLFAPFPQAAGSEPLTIAMINDYFVQNAGSILLLNIPVFLGQAAILLLLLSRESLTIGQILQRSLSMLLPVALLTILLNFIFICGMVLIVPGLYLAGRLSVATSAQMAERIKNPLTAIGRSFALTDGNGWRITGILLLVYGVGYIVMAAIGSVFGIVFTIVLPDAAAKALSALVEATLSAALLLAVLCFVASIYRQLITAPSKAI
jgi:hypothetical protein